MPFIVAEFTDDGTFIEVGRRAPEGAWQGATQVASSELSGQGNATSMSRVTMGEGAGRAHCTKRDCLSPSLTRIR